ncbi:PucR family transcriptional regulator, partial [Paenibacillus pasadenensis]
GASSRFAGAVGAEEARREAEEALRLCLLRQPQPAAARSAGGGGPATGGAAGGRATAGEAAGGAAGPYACEDAGELLCYEQLGVLQLLPALDDGRRLQAYVARHLGPLLEADRLRGGELLRTLQVFLDADGSKQEAARRLYVARQSLYYRLERIEELIGPVWLDPERRLAAELALRAYRLLHPGGLAGDAAR